ncbi:A-kinase anchor protein 8-like isoform X2 [Parambassis ranga]|uniref:DBIRD complex subunit ZNF326 n=1 Tax=Parambassis ranga TaxID=210632 RepID=A0A6P7K4U5_9TELE|nr:DBIRD complex subunit ZNF326 isoform X2 [Parambassis ranga]
MNRKNNVPFNPQAISNVASPGYIQRPPGRVPQQFIEAMKRVSATDSSNTRTSDTPAHKDKPSGGKWKSSFKPLDKADDSSQEESTNTLDRTGLYDPNSPLSSDSEPELPQALTPDPSPPNQDSHVAPRRSSRWDVPYSEPENRSVDRHHLSPGIRPTESQCLSPRHRPSEQQAYSPGYDSMSGHLDKRHCSPNKLIHGSSTQVFPATYGGQRTNGEDTTLPDFRRELPLTMTTVRLSPPKLKRDYQHQLTCVETDLDREAPPTKLNKNQTLTDKYPITCDLCDVALANGQELEDHLDSRIHWDTLEHIQQNNHYDDMTVAFLQEVMLYKSHQCSRPIEDSALQALQKNDHMTKVEMFHCAACKVFISTSAAQVQSHITSQEHISNTVEFEMRQRCACLSKAETMMGELKPQFEDFLQGGNPFQ